jgi:hypothetical protein
MNTFFKFLNDLGGLHDAVLTSIVWQPLARSIEFTFDDLYANFRGLPEDPGTHQGRILLRGVSDVLVDVDLSNRLRVFEFLPDEDHPDAVVLALSPSGRIRARFETAEHPENLMRQTPTSDI